LSQNDLYIQFPTITYNGQTAIDITRSIDMVANLVSNTTILTPYVLNQSMRSDQLASAVYDDPYLEWMLFLSNGKLDGFDWYMDQNQFYTYLNIKYGDWVLTQQTISYWLNNWYTGSNLSVSGFNALDPSLVKYYEPQFGAGGQVLQYTRRQIDWTISTNHMVQFTFDPAVFFPTFTNNEVVTVTWITGDTANGQVCYQSNTQNVLNIQHVSGDYAFGNAINATDFSIIGSQSNATLTITNSNQVSRVVYDTVSALEDIFYDPITIFDNENQINENRKYISYLPNTYIIQAMAQLQTLFS
jgi:hypothetical protein